MKSDNKSSASSTETLIKPTIFPFNVNPRDYDNSDAFSELQKIANKYGIRLAIIEDEKIRYTGSFLQIYFEGMSSLRYLKTYGLSMLNYIYRNIKFGSNWIVLNQSKIANELNVPQPRISDGIRQLIETSFIAKATGDNANVYIINHNMMFMGDRNKFIADYIKMYSLNK